MPRIGNKQNLSPVRTKDEARKIGQNGGVKSGEARREKKLLREALEKKLGKHLNEITDGLLERAKKDTRSYEVLRDTIGEKPTDRVEIGSISKEEEQRVKDLIYSHVK